LIQGNLRASGKADVAVGYCHSETIDERKFGNLTDPNPPYGELFENVPIF